MYGSPTLAAMEATTTMRPSPCSTIEGTARRMQRNGAVRLRSSIRCHCSSVVFATEAEVPAPAFATKMATGPHSASIRSKSASTKAGSVMSAGTTRVSPAQAVAVAVSSATLRAVSATRKPSALSRWATARPIPRPAPVTSAMGASDILITFRDLAMTPIRPSTWSKYD